MDRGGLNRKVIVAVAPVGRSVEPPSLNPLTPEEVATQVVDCAKMGASMVHLHVRDREGKQTARDRTSSFRDPQGGFQRSRSKSDAWRSTILGSKWLR
jgi:hypothetical protein